MLINAIRAAPFTVRATLVKVAEFLQKLSACNGGAGANAGGNLASPHMEYGPWAVNDQ